MQSADPDLQRQPCSRGTEHVDCKCYRQDLSIPCTRHNIAGQFYHPERTVDRRVFVGDLTRAAALCAVVPNVWRVTSRPRLADDPFTLGVAAGDPTSASCMIWTRLAPRPLEAEGGMDGQRVVVSWEVADDEAFQRSVKKGRATAAPELSYSVHVDVDGLAPGRWYFYRFTVGTAVSPIGRLRTAPAAGAVAPLSMAVASCQHYEQGLFTAYEHMVREELDLVMHLGDYIYEYAAIPGRVRAHVGLEIRTLDDYRRRYALYKMDPALKAMHARCPWLVTWDDHEVDNNYAGLIGENEMESEEQMRTRRAAAYQAWWEHQPVRLPRAKSWTDLSITRSVEWGGLARFWMMDERQFRSDQACGDGTQVTPCGDWADPSRTMLGGAQESWIDSGLRNSRSRWQVLGNQLMLAPFDSREGPEQGVSMDQWSGYPAARGRMIKSIASHAPNRTVIFSGDIHSSWVNEIRPDFSRPEQPSVAAEFVGTSITSGGDGSEATALATPARQSENPHMKWQHNRRGYMKCALDADSCAVDYRTVAYVSKPGAPIDTPTRWRLEHGKAGITRL